MLTPLDFRSLLSADDYWQKEDKTGKVVTPPILSHAAVQKLARAFGVRVDIAEWRDRDPAKCLVTVLARAHGYAPIAPAYVRQLFGLSADAPADLDPDWPVPDEVRHLARELAAKMGRAAVDGAYLMGDGEPEKVLRELQQMKGSIDA